MNGGMLFNTPDPEPELTPPRFDNLHVVLLVLVLLVPVVLEWLRV